MVTFSSNDSLSEMSNDEFLLMDIPEVIIFQIAFKSFLQGTRNKEQGIESKE